MKENLRKANRRIYWITLLNPIVIILFYKFMEYLSALCMYGIVAQLSRQKSKIFIMN